MVELVDSDEYAHVPNERPDWRESYYFNWVDLDSGISGFSTIGLLPNASKRVAFNVIVETVPLGTDNIDSIVLVEDS